MKKPSKKRKAPRRRRRTATASRGKRRGKMPAGLRAYWAKRRGATKRKRHTKRRHHARPRAARPVIYIVES